MSNTDIEISLTSSQLTELWCGQSVSTRDGAVDVRVHRKAEKAATGLAAVDEERKRQAAGTMYDALKEIEDRLIRSIEGRERSAQMVGQESYEALELARFAIRAATLPVAARHKARTRREADGVSGALGLGDKER